MQVQQEGKRASPVGEDNWLAYLDESSRSNGLDLEQCVNVLEHHKRAIAAEPGSLRLWLVYCDFFWSLWSATHSSGNHGESDPDAAPARAKAMASWSEEEKMMGRDIFTFNAALELWSQGYEAVKYRLDDSHLLWDRWVSLEMELLAKTKTPEGIKRITHLFRHRLATPHLRWDDTAQKYSSFLSEYNRAGYEDAMKEATASAQDAKRLVSVREPYEFKLEKAVQNGNLETQKTIMKEYLDWEMVQSKRNNDKPEIGLDLCRGLFSRALSGIFATDESLWHEYIVYVSSSLSSPQPPEATLDILQRAVQHCPWSGSLWNRYILCAEEARLPFGDIEAIKHAATSDDQLYKNGMESLIEMYVAWCGFLKRNAMRANARDEAVDVADVGLIAALEDAAVVGHRLYGKDFQGDPKYRLERIYIQYLTEKKGLIDEARAQWNKLASTQMHADNHDFWLCYYMWEMLIFSSSSGANRSPISSVNGASFRTPTLATAVLSRAVQRRTIDWPEKILDVYLHHCNDYETPSVVRKAKDTAHKVLKTVRQIREREEQEKTAAYAAYYGQDQTIQQHEQAGHASEPASPGGSKRKRTEESVVEDTAAISSKRHKGEGQGTGTSGHADTQQTAKRDRENATVLVENLPLEVTQTKIRQYFKDYGHINSITAVVRNEKENSTTALIEFRTPEEAQSALLRDGKYFGESQLSVLSGFDLTVYVANYPPIADEAYMRDLFKDCGEVLSVRWPSLKVNTHRRFCYVTFKSRDASALAVQKEGTLLDGQYRLLAKYSDPGRKKQREGAVAEGREIQVTDLDKGVTEEELRAVLSKSGTVTRINIPLSLNGKSRGIAYADFETKEQAQQAVADLNNVKLRNQIVKVQVTKESKVKLSAKSTSLRTSASPAPSSTQDHEGDEHMREDLSIAGGSKPARAEIQARTIALLNLPDTVNDARIRALVQPFEPIIQLILQPAHGGAKIEFSDASTAGKASLQLEGMELEGRSLTVGSLEDLKNATAEHRSDRITYGSSGVSKAKTRTNGREKNHRQPEAKQPKSFMPPPTAVRRPALGRAGAKRGLGFVPKKGLLSSEGKGSTETVAPGPPKTNADFKTMLFGGAAGQNKDEKKAGTAKDANGTALRSQADEE